MRIGDNRHYHKTYLVLNGTKETGFLPGSLTAGVEDSKNLEANV